MTITPNDNQWSGESRYGQDVTGGLGDGMRDINAAEKEALLKTDDVFTPTPLSGYRLRGRTLDDSGGVYYRELDLSLVNNDNVTKYTNVGSLAWRTTLPAPRVAGLNHVISITIDRSGSPAEAIVLSSSSGSTEGELHRLNITTGVIIDTVTANDEPELEADNWTPEDIAVSSHTGGIYMTGRDETGPAWPPDTNSKVKVFDDSFAYVTEFGSRGTGNGQFLFPLGVAVYNDGADSVVFVCDRQNERIQALDLSGGFLRKYDIPAEGDEPRWVAADTNGHSYFTSVDDIGDARGVTVLDEDLDLVGVRTGLVGRIAVNGSDAIMLEQFVTAYICSRYDLQQTEFSKYTTTTQTSLGTPDGGEDVPAVDALDSGAADVVPNHIVDMRDTIEVLAIDYAPSVTSAHYNWIDSDPDNLYLAAMGNRNSGDQDMGFSSPSPAYDWERTQARMEASDVVVGTDGNDYVCIIAHTATNDNRPITGIDIVVGTDGNDYRVIAGHTSTDDNKPITGPDYEDVWEATGGTGEGAAWGLGVDYVTYAKFWRATGETGAGGVWVIGTLYTTNQTYDIDIAEAQLCAAKLVTPYTFGEP